MKEAEPDMDAALIQTIDTAFDERATLTPATQGPVREAVERVLAALDSGEARVAEPTADGWTVNQWAKRAVLLSFRLTGNQMIDGAPSMVSGAQAHFYDKVANKFAGWDEARFAASGVRVVPPATVRRGSYIAPNCILMPSFVNFGAYVDEGTMIDTWATVGSCAQIGKNCHISGGTGIGGVLEPLQAEPVIIEDNCFIGARSEIAEGVRVGQGAVISMGVLIGQSTKIIDRETGEIFRGEVPPFSVVVPGTLPGKPLPDGSPGPSLACAVIVKRVDEQTRSKTGVNDLLREVSQ